MLKHFKGQQISEVGLLRGPLKALTLLATVADVCLSVSWLFLSSGHINDPCKWTLQSSRAHIKYGGISLECLTESMEQADGQTDKLSVMNKYLLFTFFEIPKSTT